jgi:hypothetical protein
LANAPAWLRTHAAHRPSGATLARWFNVVLLPLALVASWVLRGYTVRFLGLFASRISGSAAWFATLPAPYQAAFLALLPLLAWEIWVVDIKWILYGSLWRSLHPDLVLRSGASSLPRVVGRIYRVETTPRGVVLHVALRGRGIWQRVRGLQRLHASALPARLNARQSALDGEAIEETAPGEWRISAAPMTTSPTGDTCAETLLMRPLAMNQMVTKEGLEGNPYHLARVPQLLPGEVEAWEEER